MSRATTSKISLRGLAYERSAKCELPFCWLSLNFVPVGLVQPACWATAQLMREWIRIETELNSVNLNLIENGKLVQCHREFSVINLEVLVRPCLDRMRTGLDLKLKFGSNRF